MSNDQGQEQQPQRQIMTANGPITISSSAHVLFQEYLSLHYPEHPVHKISPTPFDMDDPTQLYQLYDQPFLHPNNLSFQSLDQLYRECSFLLSNSTTPTRTMLLVDCIDSSMTTDEASRKAFLSALSSRFDQSTNPNLNTSPLQIIRSTMVHMVDVTLATTTPDTIASRLEHQLLYEHAGIVGPVELSLEKGNLTLLLLQGIAQVQAKLDVPVVFTAGYQKLDSQGEQDNLALLDQYQVMVQSYQSSSSGSSAFKGILAQAQYWSIEGLTCVLKKGWNVCFDGIGLHRCASRQDPFCAPIRTSSSARSEDPPTDEALAIKIALLAKGNFSSQIVLSNGLRMRTQWRKYGGGGYNLIYNSFFMRLERDFGLSAEVLTAFIQTNPLRLLQWYQPQTVNVEIPKDYIQCDICAKAFEPIEGQYYTKFTFTYCSLGCLRKHLKMKFAPLDK